MMKFVTAHQNHHFASACTEASSACVASASSANIVIIMGAMIMASIFVIIISLLVRAGNAPDDIGRFGDEFAIVVTHFIFGTTSGSAKRQGRFFV